MPSWFHSSIQSEIVFTCHHHPLTSSVFSLCSPLILYNPSSYLHCLAFQHFLCVLLFCSFFLLLLSVFPDPVFANSRSACLPSTWLLTCIPNPTLDSVYRLCFLNQDWVMFPVVTPVITYSCIQWKTSWSVKPKQKLFWKQIAENLRKTRTGISQCLKNEFETYLC